jgi:hypothetical protein
MGFEKKLRREDATNQGNVIEILPRIQEASI